MTDPYRTNVRDSEEDNLMPARSKPKLKADMVLDIMDQISSLHTIALDSSNSDPVSLRKQLASAQSILRELAAELSLREKQRERDDQKGW